MASTVVVGNDQDAAEKLAVALNDFCADIPLSVVADALLIYFGAIVAACGPHMRDEFIQIANAALREITTEMDRGNGAMN